MPKTIREVLEECFSWEWWQIVKDKPLKHKEINTEGLDQAEKEIQEIMDKEIKRRVVETIKNQGK